MSLKTRIENIEALVADRSATYMDSLYRELRYWIDTTWSEPEREALHRSAVHMPVDDEMRRRVLAKLGLSPAQHAAILEAVPKPTSADVELVDAALARATPEQRERWGWSAAV